MPNGEIKVEIVYMPSTYFRQKHRNLTGKTYVFTWINIRKSRRNSRETFLTRRNIQNKTNLLNELYVFFSCVCCVIMFETKSREH